MGRRRREAVRRRALVGGAVVVVIVRVTRRPRLSLVERARGFVCPVVAIVHRALNAQLAAPREVHPTARRRVGIPRARGPMQFYGI